MGLLPEVPSVLIYRAISADTAYVTTGLVGMYAPLGQYHHSILSRPRMIEAVIIPELPHANIIPARRVHSDKNRRRCALPAGIVCRSRQMYIDDSQVAPTLFFILAPLNTPG